MTRTNARDGHRCVLLAACAGGRAGARPGPGGDPVLLPGGGRRARHQDHRRPGRRLREGEPRHQGEADLRGHLPGDDRQGAHRAQERRAAADVGAALHRHVHADRRGRDRPLRRRRPRAPRTRPGSRASSPPSCSTAGPAARPGASRSSAPPSSSTGTRRPSRRPGSTPTSRRPPGPRSSSTRGS